MSSSRSVPSDVAFTKTVKAIQTQKGSRSSYARMERGGGWETEISEPLSAFIAEPKHVPAHFLANRFRSRTLRVGSAKLPSGSARVDELYQRSSVDLRAT